MIIDGDNENELYLNISLIDGEICNIDDDRLSDTIDILTLEINDETFIFKKYNHFTLFGLNHIIIDMCVIDDITSILISLENETLVYIKKQYSYDR
jgi:hypothetical protein